MKKKEIFILLVLLNLIAASCLVRNNKGKINLNDMKISEENTFQRDKLFLEKYGDIIELHSGKAMILLSKKFQGRVFTSTATGYDGLSFGWINYNYFKSGKVSDQFNPYGGEERIWLGPEGGPYSIYFTRGKTQSFENWIVPRELDTCSYDVTGRTSNSISFVKEFNIKNYLGSSMNIRIEREVRILDFNEVKSILGCPIDKTLNCVAYESQNKLQNSGSSGWTKETGGLSIWMLSMFNPSEVGVVVLPYKNPGRNEDPRILTDDYFGKVPDDRLKKEEGIIYFKTDGKFRSKIGIAPGASLPVCGSYDSQKKVLTILWFSVPQKPAKYVNSVWGNNDPLNGDVVNSYNDGPLADGSIMGPFYEIESSSPAAFLAPGERIVHIQRIFHITGEEDKLNSITEKVFNTSINDIKNAFKSK
jgi:hypothetical protein